MRNEILDCEIKIRISKAEKEAILKGAKAKNKTLSEYIRSSMVGRARIDVFESTIDFDYEP